MDPMQLQAIQDMVDSPGLGVGIVPGNLPGVLAPTTGIGMFSVLTDPKTSQFQPTISGSTLPDTSPLAPFNLQQYGLPGIMAGMVGNTMLSNAMQRQGILPYGNAGSYMQAYRTRKHMQMRQDVSQQIAERDAESFYRTFRGAAALAGQPFNADQRKAARNVSETLSNFGPIFAALTPDLLDAVTGQRGSIQVLANQMTEANRYRLDPTTGLMGYSSQTNKDLINEIFDTMFSKDNIAKMKGVRAGEIGQLYKELSSEGMIGLRGNLRDRTLNVLQEARNSGTDLTALGDSVGVRINTTTDLNNLSEQDLTKLRQTGDIRTRLGKADAGQISRQLQSYVDSIAAIREIFGENGNPNAPMAQLINGLKALTSGQMQKFDANQLNMMVRDLQSMAQVSGKSIDQIVAMNQLANQQNAETLGRHGVYFNMSATRVGTTTGMAMAQQGAPVGFGALNRTETEQLAMQDYSRSLNSQMYNTLGALTRIEKRGGFTENQAGREMRAIMEAIDAHAFTYSFIDDTGKQVTKEIPLTEAAYRSLADRGAFKDMNTSDFNRELSYRTSNIRTMSENPNRQTIVFEQQANEVNNRGTGLISNLFLNNRNLEKFKDVNVRKTVADKLGFATMQAIDSMPMDVITDPQKRESFIASTIKKEAEKNNIVLSENDALTLAGQSFGQIEEFTQQRTGKDLTAHLQTKGKVVRQAVSGNEMLISARSQQNQVMSGLGRQGSLMQRMFTALQKQGDRGSKATIETFLTDALGGGKDIAFDKLSKPMTRIKELNSEIDNLISQISSATPEKRAQINKEINDKSRELKTTIDSVKDLAGEFGLDDRADTFNMTDIERGSQAARELYHLNRQTTAAMLAMTSDVTPEELKAASGTVLTPRDFEILAEADLRYQAGVIEAKFAGKTRLDGDYLKLFEQVRNQGGLTEEAARRRSAEIMIRNLGNRQQNAVRLQNIYRSGATVEDIGSLDAKKMIVRERRIAKELDQFPTIEKVSERAEVIRKAKKLQDKKTQDELDKMPEDQKKQYKENEDILMRNAEDQLIAESQLRALGQLTDKQTLLDAPATLNKLDPKLRTELINKSKMKLESSVVSEYIDKKTLDAFTELNEKDRRKAVSQSESEEGRLNVAANEKNIQELSQIRRAYLADPEAVKRGGMGAVEAIKESLEAENKLTDYANQYYGGNLGKMLAFPEAKTGQGQELLKQQFEEIKKEGTASQSYQNIVKRLKSANVNVDPNNLTLKNYAQFIYLQNKDNVFIMQSSVDRLRKAAQGKYASPELSRLNSEQIKALESMQVGMYGAVEEEARRLGLSTEEYQASVATQFDPKKPILFKSKGAEEILKEAQKNVENLKTNEKRLATVEEQLKRDDLLVDAKEKYRKEAKTLKEEITFQKGKVADDMLAAGLDINKPEDVEKYNNLLNNQGVNPANLALFKNKDSKIRLEEARINSKLLQQKEKELTDFKEKLKSSVVDPNAPVNQEKSKQLEEAVRLQKQKVADDMRESGFSGTIEEYRKQLIINPFDLILFKGKDADERLKVARANAASFQESNRSLIDVKNQLKTKPGSIELQSEFERLQIEIANRKKDIAKDMKEAGYNIDIPEDFKTYNRLLNSQEGAIELANRRRNYQDQYARLKRENLTDKQIEEAMRSINFGTTEITKAAKAVEERDLGPESYNQLAEAFGIKKPEDKQNFKRIIDVKGFAAERNRAMVANVLKTVGGFKGLGTAESTAIDKLDILSSEYEKANTSQDQEKLAIKYGISSTDLHRIMGQTSFLGLTSTNRTYRPEDLRNALMRVSGEDIAEKQKKEEEKTLRISGGTLEVTGVVRGQGTFNNVTGVQGK